MFRPHTRQVTPPATCGGGCRDANCAGPGTDADHGVRPGTVHWCGDDKTNHECESVGYKLRERFQGEAEQEEEGGIEDGPGKEEPEAAKAGSDAAVAS